MEENIELRIRAIEAYDDLRDFFSIMYIHCKLTKHEYSSIKYYLRDLRYGIESALDDKMTHNITLVCILANDSLMDAVDELVERDDMTIESRRYVTTNLLCISAYIEGDED